MTHRTATILAVAFSTAILTGCASIDRLSEVGRPPATTPIDVIRSPMLAEKINYPIQAEVDARPTSNSLWRPGSKTFLKDQRATRLGDILTADVQFSDSATLENQTSRERSNSDALNLGSMLGYASKLAGTLPGIRCSTLLLSSDRAVQVSSRERVAPSARRTCASKWR